jgi:putative SOS response-associated peptidase YedK
LLGALSLRWFYHGGLFTVCARYRLSRSPSQIARHLGVLDVDINTNPWQPRLNIAISQSVPVIRVATGHRRLFMADWGFKAPWDPAKRIFNAMAETAAAKPTFRAAFNRGRCLMPADGFYEWPGKKAALIRFADERVFCFAGLCSGNQVTMLTCAPNEFMQPIHHRMPVILESDQWDRWLNPQATSEELKSIISPRPWSDVVATPAGTIHHDAI